MVMDIVKYGDAVLRAKGRRLDPAQEGLKQLADDMLETMHAARGLGLAAQQVGLPIQLTVVDITGVSDRPSAMFIDGEEVKISDWMPLILLNPDLELSDAREIASEGCLSFPDLNADIPRASRIRVRADLLNGRELRFEATGLLARAIQHETDHLNGVLFIDRMNSATKAGLAGKLKRLQKEGAEEARRPRRTRPPSRPMEEVGSAAEKPS